MEITDGMIDRFYGEYERPGVRADKPVIVCANCGEEIHAGEEYATVPDWAKVSHWCAPLAGKTVCAECAPELAGDVYLWLSESERLSLVDMTMEVYDG